MKVKICGITRGEDAKAAADLGAEYLGFIFIQASRRTIAPEDAARLIRQLPSTVTPVGVFMNATREEVLYTLKVTGIRTIQLHGRETPEEAEGYPVPVWKAFGVDAAFRPEMLDRYRVSAFLLDNLSGGNIGGTGKPFDWSLALGAKRCGDIVLAGGITPENVQRAVETVRPFAIDVNSGVELSPGRKDHAKLRRLFESVRMQNH